MSEVMCLDDVVSRKAAVEEIALENLPVPIRDMSFSAMQC